MRKENKLPSFNAVGAGQTATLNIPTGPRYHKINIYYKDTASQNDIESDIEEIQIKVNGRVQRTFKPSQLFKMLSMNGVSFRAGLIPIYFSEPWRRNVSGEDILAWGTAGGVSTFQIDVKLAAGASAPKLHAISVTDNVLANLRDIIKYRTQVVPVTQTGLVNVHNLSRRTDEIYQRIHCFEETAGDISSIEVKLDNSILREVTAKENKDVLSDRGIVLPSGVFSLFFDGTQRLEDGLPMVYNDSVGQRNVQDFQLNFQLANANTFTILQEVRGNPEGA